MSDQGSTSGKRNKPKECAKCYENDVELYAYGGGYVCNACLERGREGRDNSTKAAHALRFAITDTATANLYDHWGDPETAAGHRASANHYGNKAASLKQVKELPEIALGEVVPRKRLRIAATLKAPDVAALDASADRIRLLDALGIDSVALAVDAAHSIKAENSLEKMLAHQLAVAHKTALQVTGRALLQQDTREEARLLNVAARFMETFQRGLLTLQRLRTGGDQCITVQHVTVGAGGQAIVGNVKAGERKK